MHLASIGIYRFNMVELGIEFGERAIKIFDAYPTEYYTIGRGLTLHSLFLGHLKTEFRENFQALNTALEASLAAGDKILHVLNMGVMSAYRVWASENLAEVEAFISSVADEISDWQESMRGGAFLIGVKQYSRALQGKTYAKTSSDVLSDDYHSSNDYVKFVRSRASNPDRPLTIYKSYELATLCRFGYYKEVIALSEWLITVTDEIWCMRYTYSNMFYVSLAIIALVREQPDRADRKQLLQRVEEYRTIISTVASHCNVNYATFLSLLDAELADISGRYGEVLQHYERAIDHAMLHSHVLDEALSLELYADWLVRKGASRPARGIVLDCISAYRRVGAFGKAQHVSERYEFLLYGTRSLSTQDAGTQTEASQGVNTSYKLEQISSHDETQTSADRTQQWLEPSLATSGAQLIKEPPAALSGGLSAVGLDMVCTSGKLMSYSPNLLWSVCFLSFPFGIQSYA